MTIVGQEHAEGTSIEVVPASVVLLIVVERFAQWVGESAIVGFARTIDEPVFHRGDVLVRLPLEELLQRVHQLVLVLGILMLEVLVQRKRLGYPLMLVFLQSKSRKLRLKVLSVLAKFIQCQKRKDALRWHFQEVTGVIVVVMEATYRSVSVVVQGAMILPGVINHDRME